MLLRIFAGLMGTVMRNDCIFTIRIISRNVNTERRLAHIIMTVRCEIAEPRRETCARSREDPKRTRAVR